MGRFALRSGLRWKVSLAIAAVSTLVAVVLSLVVHNAARVSMLDNSRTVMDERVKVAQRWYEQSRVLGFGAKLDDPKLPDQLKKEAWRGQRATYLEDPGTGTPEVWASVPLRNGKVLSVHTKFQDRFAVLNDLDRVLLIGSVAVVMGGIALGVLIGDQLSRRLRKAATAARKLAEGDSEVRVREAIGGRVRDETDDLARAVDGMAEALQQRLEAERRVTADIAHELRTPVTGLLTAAELLPPGRPTELVRDRAQAMRTLVEDVLEVARLDGFAERAELQEIAVAEFIARRVRAVHPDAVINVARDAHVSTDPRRLERIMGNLLANAARHGKPPFEVTVEGRVLRVRDHGPGFPEELLKDGPSRFRTGSKDRAGTGHGLGLTIAAGQARVLGARLTFRNADPVLDGPDRTGGMDGTNGTDGECRGAVAVLWLPESAPTNTGSFPIIEVPD